MFKHKQDRSHWTNQWGEDVHAFEQASVRSFKLETQETEKRTQEFYASSNMTTTKKLEDPDTSKVPV